MADQRELAIWLVSKCSSRSGGGSAARTSGGSLPIDPRNRPSREVSVPLRSRHWCRMSLPPHSILALQCWENGCTWQQQVAYHNHVRLKQSQNQEQHPLKKQLPWHIKEPSHHRSCGREGKQGKENKGSNDPGKHFCQAWCGAVIGLRNVSMILRHQRN